MQDVPVDIIIKTSRMNAPSTTRLSLLQHRDIRNIVKSMKSTRRKFGEVSSAPRLKKLEEARAVKSIIENDHSDVNSDEIEDEGMQKRLADIKLLRSDLIINCREIEGLIHCIDNVDTLRRMSEALNEVKSLASDALELKPFRASELFIPPTASQLVIPPTTSSELAVTTSLFDVLPATKARTILQKKVDQIVQPFPKKVSISKLDEHVRIRHAISMDPVLTAIVLDEHSDRAYSFPGYLVVIFHFACC